MNRYGYDGDDAFRPLTPWGYVGYSLLFCIPVIGLICLIVYSISDRNINRRSYARSYWCGLIISLLLTLIAILIMVVTGVGANLLENLERLYP